MDTELLTCWDTAERDAATIMVERLKGTGRVTVGADKGYDTKDLVAVASNLPLSLISGQDEA